MDHFQPPDLPPPDPLPEAVWGGVFGLTVDGPLAPDDEAVRAIMAEQASELRVHLSQLDWLRHCWDEGRYPHSGKRPSQIERLERLRRDIGKMIFQTQQAYENCLAAYEEGFGETAARELDQYVRQTRDERPPVQTRLFR